MSYFIFYLRKKKGLQNMNLGKEYLRIKNSKFVSDFCSSFIQFYFLKIRVFCMTSFKKFQDYLK